MATIISECPGPQAGGPGTESEGWTGLVWCKDSSLVIYLWIVRFLELCCLSEEWRWHLLNPGMSACIELRVHSFQLASGTAVAWSKLGSNCLYGSLQLCSRLQYCVGPRRAEKEVFPGWGRIEDCLSKSWYARWFQVHNRGEDRK
eukprot:914533-Pelagomonas_calceolata.AAC.1